MPNIRPCEIDGCENVTGKSGTARGWCSTHYRRWQRYGDPLAPVKRLSRYQEEETCLHADCDLRPMARGMCDTHYARVLRAADPEKQKQRNRTYAERRESDRERVAGRPRPTTCELCDEQAETAWDHCHQSGLFRGWICHRCNRVLGSVGDGTDLLRKMIDYLEASDDQGSTPEAAT